MQEKDHEQMLLNHIKNLKEATVNFESRPYDHWMDHDEYMKGFRDYTETVAALEFLQKRFANLR